jgi:hypothetical protein
MFTWSKRTRFPNWSDKLLAAIMIVVKNKLQRYGISEVTRQEGKLKN